MHFFSLFFDEILDGSNCESLVPYIVFACYPEELPFTMSEWAELTDEGLHEVEHIAVPFC